jgi:hypothetical protein
MRHFFEVVDSCPAWLALLVVLVLGALVMVASRVEGKRRT